MANGYWGNLLEVDMTAGTVNTTDRHMQYIEEYIGGGPLASRMLWEALKDNPGIDALGPENVLMIFPGPLSGSGFPGASSRYISYCKSPHTWAKNSEYGDLSGTIGFGTSGGKFAAALKMSGFDGVYITGRSETLKYLLIDNGRAELIDCPEYHDMTTAAFEEAVQARHGDLFKVISVGPAAEHGVTYSALISECGRAAGRGGTGAVMGSKGLKGIVCQGDMAVPTACTNMFEKFDEYWNAALGLRATATNRTFGTINALTSNSVAGLLCTRNHSEGTNPHDNEIGAAAIFKNFIVKSRSCFACPHYCMKCGILKQGEYKGTVADGPDYEFGINGANWLIQDVNAYMKIVQTIEDMGFDNISCGGLVGYALQAYEEGVITSDMIDGISLEWGNAEEILRFLDRLIYGEGDIWNWLRRGATYTATRLDEMQGTESVKYAMEVKNASFAAHGLQAQPNEGRIVSYAFATQGASHTFGRSVSGQDQNMGTNSGCTCNRGANTPYGASGVADMLNCIMGTSLTGDDLVTLGAKTINRDTVLNIMNGFRKIDNEIPRQAFEHPLTWGPRAGAVVDEAQWNDVYRYNYIEARGWDHETEFPTIGKLQELGLNDVIPYLNGVIENM